MSEQRWSAVDDYFAQSLSLSDPVLDAALRACRDADLPPINVAPNQGKLLHLLARIRGARRILEIGTLGGYSTIWLARALPPDGKLISLEIDPKHAAIARTNVAAAGLQSLVDIRVGPALELLPKLQSEGPFDLTFIDADKINSAPYFSWALKLSRSGSLIIVDNVVREGAIIEKESSDAGVHGVRRFVALLAKEKRAQGTVLQTVGVKGYDGLALVLVTSE